MGLPVQQNELRSVAVAARVQLANRPELGLSSPKGATRSFIMLANIRAISVIRGRAVSLCWPFSVFRLFRGRTRFT